jgi:hypothetical protein
MTAADGHRARRTAQMARRLSLYSGMGTCWNAQARSGREASLAPKRTVTAATAEETVAMARPTTREAQRVL